MEPRRDKNGFSSADSFCGRLVEHVHRNLIIVQLEPQKFTIQVESGSTEEWLLEVLALALALVVLCVAVRSHSVCGVQYIFFIGYMALYSHKIDAQNPWTCLSPLFPYLECRRAIPTPADRLRPGVWKGVCSILWHINPIYTRIQNGSSLQNILGRFFPEGFHFIFPSRFVCTKF